MKNTKIRFYLFGFIIILNSIIIGTIIACFIRLLSLASSINQTFPFLILFIPILGILTAFCYAKFGKNSNRGNNLIIENIHEASDIPWIMLPFSFIFTISSHIFGASVGREGTSLQIGGTISSMISKCFRLNIEERKILILSGISAGFGSIFGTPFAGAFFGMEVSDIGYFRKEAMVPCLLSSFTANLVCELLGSHHTRYTITQMPSASFQLITVIILSAIIFGLIGRYFSVLLHKIKHGYAKALPNIYIRSIVTSIILVITVLLFRTMRYNGLSTWMIDAGFNGSATWIDPIKKFILTILSLGAGFQGGEATPLFDIGASTGGLIATFFSLDPSLIAALGYICVFGSAANIPLTSIILGVELFGMATAPYFVLSAIVSYYVIGHHGIYEAQKINTPKYPWLYHQKGETLDNISNNHH